MNKDYEVKFSVVSSGEEDSGYICNTFGEAKSEAFKLARNIKSFVRVLKRSYYKGSYIDNSSVEVMQINGAELYA